MKIEGRHIYIYIYIYARELAGCPPFFCFKASWLSTFFSFFFSLIKKKTFPTRDWHISRPFRNTFQGQLVVHPLASWLSTFFADFQAKMWTTSWLGGGQPAGLEIYDCRPQKSMIASFKKHCKNRYFMPTTKNSTITYTKFYLFFGTPPP